MQELAFPPRSSSQARILILSMRDLEFHVSRSSINELENCICSWEEVDMLTIPYFNKSLTSKIKNSLAKKYFKLSGNAPIFNPINNYFVPNKNYDLFFYICQKPIDLIYLNSIKNWRDRCNKAVCFIDEVWLKDYAKQEKQLSVLKKFDCIFTNLSLSTKAVTNTTQKPCYYLAPGIDAVKFCPYPLSPQRSIDVCSFGRRPLTVHQELLSLEEQENFLYIYDTLQYLFVDNYHSHRALYQRLIKRSKYFIAYPAKFDSKSEVGAQEELNIRFFEGAAGGAVILGTPPKNETFNQSFDWQDAVVQLPADATNVRKVIADLNAQPERLTEIRKNNVVNSLLRHDWVYRWEQILDRVGLSHTPKMVQRRAYLRTLADMALQKSS